MAVKTPLSRDSNPLSEEQALREHINRALATEPPSGLEEQLIYRFSKFWFRPELHNVHRLPDKPCLFIGNHALFGLDGFVILPVLLQEYGRFLRPMGDKFLFAQPRVAKTLIRRGATMGHPDVARALMAHDQDILVFPGGAHEAVKPSRERYQLQWKERLGFIRLAAEFGYTIVPFGLVGPDEFYEYLLDSEQIVKLLKQTGFWSDNMRPDAIPPLLRGVFGTPMPRPQASYLSFGEPLELPRPTQRAPGKKKLQAWRSIVAERIDSEIADMLLRREQSRHELSIFRRIANV
ncbi:lysophospholipid acyltransferase family protein [Congregibacter sp.]|uniref:lysophospholipid acyltransferase family protein n=1 Tax=Congregibacter sp. TaxID=2744308 RepID=UPI003F6AD6E5